MTPGHDPMSELRQELHRRRGEFDAMHGAITREATNESAKGRPPQRSGPPRPSCRNRLRSGLCHDPFLEPASGGGGSWKCVLDPWPYWSQLSDWTEDADQTDENATQNCGPSSIAMCLKHLTGVEQPADFIKDVILGEGAVGNTTAWQLANYLKTYCNIPTDVFSCGSRDNFEWRIWDGICHGRPQIWLRYFGYVGDSYWHWCPINYADQAGIGEADPWTGSSRKFSYADAWQWGGGSGLTLLNLRRVRWDED